MQTLFTKDAKGKIRVWQVEEQAEGFILNHGEKGGILQSKYIDVTPKSNRTMNQQIDLEINSRINKQLDKGYVWTEKNAIDAPKTNALGLIKPMLATPIDKVKNADYNSAVIQRKYNGHRCMITNTEGNIVAYSRNGKPITSIDHITNELNIPLNTTLDGELYVHNTPLQKISSIVKKEQEMSKHLRFVAYDTIMDSDYSERLAELMSLPASSHFQVAGTYSFNKGEELDYMQKFVEEGFEGAIIRLDGYSYEDAKRSKGLIKVKPKYDGEFKVIGMEQSSDGWARLVCEMPSSAKVFRVSAMGTIPEKHQIWREREAHIGRHVQIEYYDLTQDGILFHPVALRWRDKQ